MGVRRPGLVRAGSRRMLAAEPAPASGGGGYEQLVRSDLYVCAGLLKGCGSDDPPIAGDGAGGAENGGIDTAGANFGRWIFGIPEVAWADGTLSSVGFFCQGIPLSSARVWAGIAANTIVAGNNYPGAVVASYMFVQDLGWNGTGFRSGPVAVPVEKGEVFWVVTQQESESHDIRGSRVSSAFRPALGEATPDHPSGNPVVPPFGGYMGMISAAVEPFGPPATFPPGANLLRIGRLPIGQAGALTSLRPSTYIKLTPS